MVRFKYFMENDILAFKMYFTSNAFFRILSWHVILVVPGKDIFSIYLNSNQNLRVLWVVVVIYITTPFFLETNQTAVLFLCGRFIILIPVMLIFFIGTTNLSKSYYWETYCYLNPMSLLLEIVISQAGNEFENFELLNH